MTEIIEYINHQFSQIEPGTFLQWALWIAFAVFLCFLGARLLLGKGAGFDAVFGGAFVVLLIYVTGICFYGTQNHYNILFASLPYVDFTADYITIFSLKGAGLDVFCSEVVSMMLLVFLVGIINDILPKGSTYITWIIFRYIVAVLGLGAHAIVTYLCQSFLPEGLVTYAPTIMFLLGFGLTMLYLFKWIITVVLGIALNAFLAGFFNILVENAVLKRIRDALVGTMLLTILVVGLDLFGFTGVYQISAMLVSFLPVFLIISIIVYLVSKVL